MNELGLRYYTESHYSYAYAAEEGPRDFLD